ncbi:hypothetical protein ACKVMT_10060 [Halobacteriales archaeon Cl-PHB]
MTTRDQLTQERLDALLAMLVDDGRKPPGEVDPAHAEQLQQTRDIGEAAEVSEAHAEGREPPENVGRST